MLEMSEKVLVPQEIGGTELRHLFCACAVEGKVLVQHEIATPELGEMGVSCIAFSPVRARCLGRMLIDYADGAEKENANEQG